MRQQFQSALVGTANGGVGLVHNSPVPKAIANRILIKIKAVSVNPVDTKLVGAYATAGAVAGSDFCGVVVEIGLEAMSRGFQVGDRVCTAVLGMNPANPIVGAFSEYTTVSDLVLLRIPSSWSFEAGASLGISFMAVGMALVHSLELPGTPLRPIDTPIPVLVFGGSYASGCAAIQLLKLAGYDPNATCSPHNFDLARSYGASAVYDYKVKDSPTEIKKLTQNGLRYAIDCISTTASMQFCYDAIGRSGGKYVALEPYSEAVSRTRKVIKADWIMGPALFDEEIGWPKPHGRPADPAAAKFGAQLAAMLNILLEKGMIRHHALLIRKGGLENVFEGIQEVATTGMSGKKLVYTLE